MAGWKIHKVVSNWESERLDIRKRQEQGITATKAGGVRSGRPEARVPEGFPKIVKTGREKGF